MSGCLAFPITPPLVKARTLVWFHILTLFSRAYLACSHVTIWQVITVLYSNEVQSLWLWRTRSFSCRASNVLHPLLKTTFAFRTSATLRVVLSVCQIQIKRQNLIDMHISEERQNVKAGLLCSRVNAWKHGPSFTSPLPLYLSLPLSFPLVLLALFSFLFKFSCWLFHLSRQCCVSFMCILTTWYLDF